jgi:hypothetical protein
MNKQLREIYEDETGNIFPSGNQIAISEWFIDYYKWIENKLLDFYQNDSG